MKQITLLLFSLITLNVLSQTSCACCDSSHTQFDFWVGEWNVMDASGKQVGENNISKLEDGCILQEQWKGAVGGTGTSTNYFNPSDSTWNQLWISNTGGILQLKGRFEDNKMVLKSELVKGKLQTYYNQISWTPNDDGTVTQRWELYSEKGELLQVLFHGVYHKQNGAETATITCPECGYKKKEQLPTDVCQIKYTCENCKATFGPKDGDCCVYCSYGDHKCPSKQ